MHLEWRTDCGNFGLVIEKGSWETVKNECAKSANQETGGILIGYYSDDNRTAIICEATPPPNDSRKGKSWFWRGVTGLRSLLLDRWNQRQRTYYLGEWHYHPTQIIEPSFTDLKQMIDISKSRRYHCSEPILIIVGCGSKAKTLARAFVFPKGHERLEFVKV
jgi:integrative and conjugative element protein (TIGR02256 family)